MSRIGKIPVVIPKEAKIFIDNGAVRVEGPKGKLSLPVPLGIAIEQKDGKIQVSRNSESKQSRANQGTIRAHIINMLVGVTKGHRRDLEIQGVGFRAAIQGTKLVLNLGFSHQVEFPIPNGIKIATPKPTEIVVEGIDNSIVGDISANIRSYKIPEPYKGKGIRYLGEQVRRKQGKSVTK